MSHEEVELEYRAYADDLVSKEHGFSLCADGVRHFFDLPSAEQVSKVLLFASKEHVTDAVKCSAVSEDGALARFGDEWAIDPNFGDWLASRVPVWLWIEFEEVDAAEATPDTA